MRRRMNKRAQWCLVGYSMFNERHRKSCLVWVWMRENCEAGRQRGRVEDERTPRTIFSANLDLALVVCLFSIYRRCRCAIDCTGSALFIVCIRLRNRIDLYDWRWCYVWSRRVGWFAPGENIYGNACGHEVGMKWAWSGVESAMAEGQTKDK